MAAYSNGKPQSPNSYIIFDFETGGLSSIENPATEIALIAIRGDDSLDEIVRYQQLIKPYNDNLLYTSKAEETSGITQELIEDEGKSIIEVVDKVIDLFKAANAVYNPKNSPGLRPVLVGHNVVFDIGFLQHIFEERFKDVRGTNGQTQLGSFLHGRTDHFGNFQPTYIDTWCLGKMWFGGGGELANYQLGTLTEKAGVELSDAHRAMNDTIATTDLFRTVIRNLRSGYGVGDEGSNQNKRANFRFPI